MKYNEVPWEQNAQTYIKVYTGPAGLPGRLLRLPIHIMDIQEQIIFPGRNSGKHRHVGEEVHKIL